MRRIVILLVVIVTIFAAWKYINSSVLKSKAGGSTVDVSLSYETSIIPVGGQQDVYVSILPNPSSDNIVFVDITLTTDGQLQIAGADDMQGFIAADTSNQANFQKIVKDVTANRAHLVYLISDATAASIAHFTLHLTGTTVGGGNLTVDQSHLQVVSSSSVQYSAGNISSDSFTITNTPVSPTVQLGPSYAISAPMAQSFAVGSNVRFAVEADTQGRTISSKELTISCDPGILQYSHTEAGDMTLSSVRTDQVTLNSFTVTATNFTGHGSIAIMNFTVLQTPPPSDATQICSLVPSISSPPPSPSLSPVPTGGPVSYALIFPTGGVQPNNNIEFTIEADTHGQPVPNLQVGLRCNMQAVQYVSMAPGSLVSSSTINYADPIPTGDFYIEGHGASVGGVTPAPIQGRGVFVTVTFHLLQTLQAVPGELCSLFTPPSLTPPISAFPTDRPYPLPTSCPTQGDVKCDGLVDRNDFDYWAGSFMSVLMGLPPSSTISADLNGDGAINLFDFENWRANYFR